MITKEQTLKAIEDIKLQREFDKQSRHLLKEVTLMCEELLCADKDGFVTFEVNAYEGKVLFGYASKKEKISFLDRQQSLFSEKNGIGSDRKLAAESKSKKQRQLQFNANY
jgi:hypothetical protein